MDVYIPWENAFFPLRSHQHDEIEYDLKGPFLRVRNADTNRLNKCRVRGRHLPYSKSLDHLIGKRIVGTVARTGPNYIALLVERIEGLPSSSFDIILVQMAKQYLKTKRVNWKVTTPRSWTLPISHNRQLGPHVSLHSVHSKDVGKQFALTIVRVMHWKENSRWVALELNGPLIDLNNWILHLSCAQEML